MYSVCVCDNILGEDRYIKEILEIGNVESQFFLKKPKGKNPPTFSSSSSSALS